MAGVTSIEILPNCLSSVMWVEDGVQYRSNVLPHVGAKVGLHAHSYDHTARIQGRMRMTVDGVESEVVTGQEIFIPAWARHSFELLEGDFGEVLCFWPVGAGQ